MGAAKYNTNFKGIRYREHPTRKHGDKKDRYFFIRYQKNRKRREEGLGWASEKWTAEKAALILAELKNAAQTGKAYDHLAKRRKAKHQIELLEEKSALTLSKVFDDHYFPQALEEKKEQSYKREKSLFKKWIQPVIGKLPMKEIAPIHLYRIKKNMGDNGLSDRSIQYALAVVRQVFNFALRNDLWTGENPVKKVKPPSVNNRRKRFLTPDEADKLLQAVKAKSQELYEICIISLHCGLRAGEIFKLKWSDIDITNETLLIRNETASKSRHAYMTATVRPP